MYVRTRATPFWRATHSRDDDAATDTPAGSYARIIFYTLLLFIIIGFNDRRATEILTTRPRAARTTSRTQMTLITALRISATQPYLLELDIRIIILLYCRDIRRGHPRFLIYFTRRLFEYSDLWTF